MLGEWLFAGLQALVSNHEVVIEVCGCGLMCVFMLSNVQLCDDVIWKLCEDEYVLVLGSGEASIWFWPVLIVLGDEFDCGLAVVGCVFSVLS